MNMKRTQRRRAKGNCLMGIAVALLCMTFIGCGDGNQTVSIPFGEPVEIPEETEAAREDGETVIYVHVCGAVNLPGVVTLPEGSRGRDALEGAGGFAPDAAEDFVNLAKPLTDGMQLYFPTREEAESLRESERQEQSELVNINTADVELLSTLPGIGEARAKAIVEYRKSNGDFQNIEDIMQVSGIKDSAFGKIRDLITVK